MKRRRIKITVVTITTVVPHGVRKTSSRREEGTWTILPHLSLLLSPPHPHLLNVFSRAVCGALRPPLRWKQGKDQQHFTVPKSPIFSLGLRRVLSVAASAAHLVPILTPAQTPPPGLLCLSLGQQQQQQLVMAFLYTHLLFQLLHFLPAPNSSPLTLSHL